MRQFVKILPHPAVNGAVSSLHGKPGFQDIAVLQHIIRYQKATGRKEPQNFRQKKAIWLPSGEIFTSRIQSGVTAPNPVADIARRARTESLVFILKIYDWFVIIG